VLAPQIIRITLGPKFDAAVIPFQLLQLCVPMAVLRNAIGMNWLLPMRLERAAGVLVMAGFGINTVLAAQLGRPAGAPGIAGAAVLSELVVLLGYAMTAWRASSSATTRTILLCARQQECCR